MNKYMSVGSYVSLYNTEKILIYWYNIRHINIHVWKYITCQSMQEGEHLLLQSDS